MRAASKHMTVKRKDCFEREANVLRIYINKPILAAKIRKQEAEYIYWQIRSHCYRFSLSNSAPVHKYLKVNYFQFLLLRSLLASI